MIPRERILRIIHRLQFHNGGQRLPIFGYHRCQPVRRPHDNAILTQGPMPIALCSTCPVTAYAAGLEHWRQGARTSLYPLVWFGGCSKLLLAMAITSHLFIVDWGRKPGHEYDFFDRGVSLRGMIELVRKADATIRPHGETINVV